MASIARRVLPGDAEGKPTGKWRARYRDAAGRQHARHFDRRADAQRWLDEVKVSVLTGQYVDPAAGNVTLKVYAESWRAAQPHRRTTAAHYETMLRRHVYPTLGDRLLADLRPTEMQAWVTGVGLQLQPATVRTVASIVGSILRAAVADRKITTSPAARWRLPRPASARVVPLTVEQVRSVAAALPSRYLALVLAAAGTGLRQGECLGLTVDRVDFLRRDVRVDRQLVTMPGSSPYLAPPKSTASVRTVPLPVMVGEALATHLAEFGAHPDGFIFTTGHGRPVRRASMAQLWRTAADKVGLPGHGFHSLRHHYASLLIHHGESVKVVQARLGHATAAETLETYGHLWPDSEDQTRAAVDAAWAFESQDRGDSAGTSGSVDPL